jgi:hypothetical protein
MDILARHATHLRSNAEEFRIQPGEYINDTSVLIAERGVALQKQSVQDRRSNVINEKDVQDMIPEGGLKYDQSKPRMDLLDFDALEGLAKVLTFGANKYAAHNWRKGISYSRLTAAMLRHLAALQKGEDIDPESGLPHIDHLGCCWMFLSNMTKTRPDLDDRFKEHATNTK